MKDEKNKIRKYKISLIFQNNNLISDLNVIENVMLPLLIRGENRKKSYEKLKKILHSVNLSNRLIFSQVIYLEANNKELQ